MTPSHLLSSKSHRIMTSPHTCCHVISEVDLPSVHYTVAAANGLNVFIEFEENVQANKSVFTLW